VFLIDMLNFQLYFDKNCILAIHGKQQKSGELPDFMHISILFSDY